MFSVHQHHVVFYIYKARMAPTTTINAATLPALIMFATPAEIAGLVVAVAAAVGELVETVEFLAVVVPFMTPKVFSVPFKPPTSVVELNNCTSGLSWVRTGALPWQLGAS